MARTRREFLQSGAGITLGMMGAAAAGQAAPEAAAEPALAKPPCLTADGKPCVQIPTMKFGNAEIGRVVLGSNPLNGFSHFNATYSSLMRDWFTEERASAVMQHATRFGINALIYSAYGKFSSFWERFQADGGKMHLLVGNAGADDPAEVVRKLKPHAMHRQGEVVDIAYRTGKMDQVREWCKRARDTGVLVGVATHKPEVIALIEEQNWDVDYLAGCVYHRTRSDEEWRKALSGELMEMSREIYMQSDPPRMYKVLRQSPKPCFAFKILAAGRVTGAGVEQAFRTAFASLKPTDGVWVGMFPRDHDQIRENAEMVHRILTTT